MTDRKVGLRNFSWLIFLLFCNMELLSQEIFLASNPAYRQNHFVVEFNLRPDSTCTLREYYADDFAQYMLCTGKLQRISDTSFQFIYQPVVKFGLEMRGRRNSDSMYVRLQTIDTTFTDSVFSFENQWKRKQSRTVKDSMENLVSIPGIGAGYCDMDTKFTDPLSGKKIIMRIDTHSQPVMIFYGHQTARCRSLVVQHNNTLEMYPDFVHLWDKRKLVSTKKQK